MDRFMPNRRRSALLLAMTLTLAVWPATGGHAKPPIPVISDEMSGDPGDGVLRPADATTTAPPPVIQKTGSSVTGDAPAPLRLSGPFILVPYFAAPGQPWSLSFRLVRVESSTSFVGRWHRAP